MKQKLFILLALGTFFCQAQNKYRALVIGVSRYSQLPKESQLQFADDDANEFYNFLLSKAAGNFDSSSVKLLLNEKATAGQIYSALDWLIDVTKENDKVIIYFSGHGDIEKKTVRQRGFLLAHDSPQAGYQVGGTVKISDLQDYMETLVTQNKARVTLVTDACRSGKLAGGEAGATQTTAALQEQWASVVKILSSQSGELSEESTQWGAGHGVFTFNLIKALSGMADADKDGFVSLLELNIYLSTEVPKATGDTQHPVVTGNLSSKISKADEHLMAAIIAKEGPGAMDKNNLLASNKGFLGVTDTTSKRLYRNFLSAIESNNLVVPDEGNAYTYFRQLETLNASNTPFTNELKRTMVAHLEDDAQKVLNRYMSQDHSLRDNNYSFAKRELDSALRIIPVTHSRYKSIESKKLFLDADILGCTCHKSDVPKKKAAASLAALKQAVALDSEAAYLYNSMGNAYFYLGNYDSAIISYSKSIELAPTWTYAVNNLGTAYKGKKDTEKALAMYKKAIEITPKDPKAYNFIGNLYDLDQKMEWYKKGYEFDPEYFTELIAEEYFYRKDYANGIKYLDKYVEQSADKFEAAKENGMMLRRWADFDFLVYGKIRTQSFIVAMKYFDVATAMKPDSIVYLYDFGNAFMGYNNEAALDGTIKYFTQFVKALRNHPYNYEHESFTVVNQATDEEIRDINDFQTEITDTFSLPAGQIIKILDEPADHDHFLKRRPAMGVSHDISAAYNYLSVAHKKKGNKAMAYYYLACYYGTMGNNYYDKSVTNNFPEVMEIDPESNHKAAWAELERALKAGFKDLNQINAEFGLAPIREDEEFKALIAKIL